MIRKSKSKIAIIIAIALSVSVISSYKISTVFADELENKKQIDTIQEVESEEKAENFLKMS